MNLYYFCFNSFESYHIYSSPLYTKEVLGLNFLSASSFKLILPRRTGLHRGFQEQTQTSFTQGRTIVHCFISTCVFNNLLSVTLARFSFNHLTKIYWVFTLCWWLCQKPGYKSEQNTVLSWPLRNFATHSAVGSMLEWGWGQAGAQMKEAHGRGS